MYVSNNYSEQALQVKLTK